MESLGDLARALPLADQAKDLQFTVAEPLTGRARLQRWSGDEMGGDPALQFALMQMSPASTCWTTVIPLRQNCRRLALLRKQAVVY